MLQPELPANAKGVTYICYITWHVIPEKCLHFGECILRPLNDAFDSAILCVHAPAVYAQLLGLELSVLGGRNKLKNL